MKRRQFLQIVSSGLLSGSLSGCGLTFGNLLNCRISDNYREAIGEIEWLMIKVRMMNGANESLLDEPKTARIYLTSFASARRAYERWHGSLPNCARPLNNRLIETLQALEAVLSARVAGRREQDPTGFEALVGVLDERWSAYAQAKDTTLRAGGVLEGKLQSE
jgi:hypothetical protein